MRLLLPRLYVILDVGRIRGPLEETARCLLNAGVQLLQYRAKSLPAREMLGAARAVAEIAKHARASLFVNDRPDIALLAGADGVHVGQNDMNVAEARSVIGPERWVGVSTHNREQFEKAVLTSADYIAVGPIFPTTSKAEPDPVVGTELLRQMRGKTERPIVAIGGIRLEHAAEVIEAGADSVAVISGILDARDPAERAREYIERLEAARPAAGR